MFMIVSNEGRNLIAIGERLLKVWGMADVFDAAQAYQEGRIKFNRERKTVQLGEGRRLKCQVSEIESVVGPLSLCIVRVPACGEDEIVEIDNYQEDKIQKSKKRTKEQKESESLNRASLISEPEDEFSLDDFVQDEEEKNEAQRVKEHQKATLKEDEKTKKEVKESKNKKVDRKIDDNSKALNIDSLLMSDDVSDTLVVDEDKKLEPKEPKDINKQKKDESLELEDIFEEISPSSSEKRESSFDLDTLLEDDKKDESLELNTLLDEPKDKTPITSAPKEEPKRDEDELDLDLLLSDDKPKVAKEEPKEESIDDDIDLDDLFSADETPTTSAPKEKPKRDEDELDLDLLLSDDEPKVTKEEPKEKSIDDDLDLDDLFDADDTPSSPAQKETKEAKAIDDDLDFGDFDLDDLFGEDDTPSSPAQKESSKSTQKTPKIESTPVELDNSSDILSLKGDEPSLADTKKAPKSQTTSSSLGWRDLIDGFNIDLTENAKRMEFDQNEYEDLIESFIRDSKDLENVLRFGNLQDKESAIATLSDAISLLHLSPLDKLLQEITKDNDTNSVIDAFYKILADIEEKIQQSRDKRNFATNQPTPQSSTPKEPTPKVETKEAEVSNNTAPTEIISVDEFLKDVKIVPIEFSIKIAADELNLPEDLVLEFVNDFSNQGHEYIPELIDAYQKGDLDRLQKTAHMLKGAASNLRIEPMVQNLYDLQFDNDLSRAPERIKLFAGQLMSLDQYLKQLNNN